MQEYSVAFGRVSHAALSANPELRAYVADLVSRAYFNLHGAPFSVTDPQWQTAICAAATQLCLNEHVQQLSTRELIHLFENVIRVSEEHLREARRHAAMATNVFYLKETLLDTILHTPAAPVPASSTVVMHRKHGGRVGAALPTSEDVA